MRLLSICIPTRNREEKLKNTLDNILKQCSDFKDSVELCISDNASTDNTQQMVLAYREKYPNICIKYNINSENLGYDRNILKLVSMAESKFMWTFGDYSSIVLGGLKRVIDFLENIDEKNTGIVGIRQITTVDNIIVDSTVDKSQQDIVEIKADMVIEKTSFRGIVQTILNTSLTKKLIKENNKFVEFGIGKLYMHTWLYYLLFIVTNNNNLNGYILNVVIVSTPYPLRKVYVEDFFLLVVDGDIRFNGILEDISKNSDNEVLSLLFNKRKQDSKIAFCYYLIKLKLINKYKYGFILKLHKIVLSKIKIYRCCTLFSIFFNRIHDPVYCF